jgi:hypothetical protein
MATVIQIKRSVNDTAPATTDLAEGELAYSQDKSGDGANAILYIESVDSGNNQVIQKIGGKYYTDIIDGATDANTASKLVKRDSSGNFSAGTITASLTGNVTGNVTGDVTGTVSDVSNHDTDDISEGSTNLYHTTARARGAISVSGDLSYDSSTGVISFTNDAGDIEGVTAGAGLTGGGDSGAVTLNVVGGTGITANANDIAITDTGVTAASYGSTTAVPVITVNAQGQITAASTASIATSFDISDGSNSDTVAGGETLTFSGTSNETDITVSNNEVTVGLVTNPTIGGNLTVSGNLSVAGTTTSVNSTNLEVNDPLFKMGANNDSSDAIDLGFYGLYDTSGSLDLYAGLFRDANDGKWKLFKDSQSEPTTTVDTTATGYSVATLVANLEGNVTGNITGGTVSGLTADIAVTDGGTGAGSFTSNGILYGNGTGALQVTAAGTDGQILVSNSGTPEFTSTLDGGSY